MYILCNSFCLASIQLYNRLLLIKLLVVSILLFKLRNVILNNWLNYIIMLAFSLYIYILFRSLFEWSREQCLYLLIINAIIMIMIMITIIISVLVWFEYLVIERNVNFTFESYLYIFLFPQKWLFMCIIIYLSVKFIYKFQMYKWS